VTANAYDVSVLLGNGNGTFKAATNISIGSTPETNPQSVAVGDFNGDAKLDLVVASLSLVGGYYQSYPGAIVDNVLLGHGDGSFGTPSVTGVISGQRVFNAAVKTQDEIVAVP
jgi:FG-GAP-like repeat